MKKGLNQCSSLPQNISYREQFEMTKKAGFEGIELNITKGLTDEEIKEINELAREFELPVLGLMSSKQWEYQMTSNDAAIREKGKEHLKELIVCAKGLNVETVLLVLGVVDENVTYLEAYKNAMDSIMELKSFIEEMQVYVCIENVWNKFLTTAFEMRDFIDKIDSKYVCSYFDVGNVLINGYPEYWIEILGERIKRVHIKDFKPNAGGGGFFGFVDLAEGDVRWDKVMEALRKIGYDDYLTCEVATHSLCPMTSLENMSKVVDEIMAL